MRGNASMARAASPDSANSQFFICFDDAAFLNGQYNRVGQGDLGHGERRQDQARGAGEEPRTRSSRRTWRLTRPDRRYNLSSRTDGRVYPGHRHLSTMRTDLFDFELPESNIALRPASPRDAARMLVVTPDEPLADAVVRDLRGFLKAGDQLVVNDTKVIPAQLSGRRLGRETEPKIDATMIKRIDGSRWQALVRPARKLAVGDAIRFGNEGRICLLRKSGRTGGVLRRERRGYAGVFVSRPGAGSGHRRCRRAAATAVHRLEADARRARCDRLSDHVRGQRRGGRRAPPRGCISRPNLSLHCALAASACIALRCMSGQGRFCR